MTQRNPMNERYQSEDRKGATRKSAASAKPVSKAASSVRIESTKKTPQQKKAERKQQRAKDAERDRQFYNPPTAEYKRLRKIWWVCLILAIILTVVSFAGNNLGMPAPIMYVTLALAYVFIIAALYIDMANAARRARSTPTRCSITPPRRCAPPKRRPRRSSVPPKSRRPSSRRARAQEEGPVRLRQKEEGRVGTAKQVVSPSRPSKTENKRVPARCPLAF